MADIADLSSDELLRYARHLTLPGIGVAGQQKLKAARVLLVGAGGLGSPAALYLAAAGVGTLGIVDNDVVDLSNLQRQVLHETPAVGERKTRSASRRVTGINPHVQVETFDTRLSSANAREIIREFDLVLDGSDNFPTRYLVNDACVLEGKPLVSGSILRFEGQLSLFATPDGPCYRCLFAEPPAADLVPSCADAGVLGVLPGVIGTLQALEAIKWIVGLGRSTVGRLLVFDALELRLREVAVRRDPACVICGDTPALTELIDYEAFCGAPRFATADAGMEVEPLALARALATAAPPFVLDVREPWEFALGHLPAAHLVPLGSLATRLADLPRHRELVTVCHHGGRSLSARALLIRAGFSPVRSLAGGMDAWAVEVDHEIKRY